MWATLPSHKLSTKNRRGFTIVELLIVVVVIAILAAITIVSFNGVQNRAKNQQTVSAVRTYYNALSAYGVKNNTLPSSRSCLGPQSFYVDNPCYIGSGSYTWGSGLNGALNDVISNQPATATGVASGGITVSGIFYDNASGTSGYIGFPIFGTSVCPGVAGAELLDRVILGSDVYCKIKTPGF